MEIEFLDSEARKSICDQITLSDIHEFQSFGVVIIIDPHSLQIIHHSDNIFSVLKTKMQSLFHLKITQFLESNHKNIDIIRWIRESNKITENFTWVSDDIIPIWVHIHHQQNCIILEIETVEKELGLNHGFPEINRFSNLNLKKYFREEKNQSALCAEIKNMIGCDRVFLYQFGENNDGVVIGEAMEDNMESYLGFRFPETDVPYHVRQMFLSQPIRYIPDIHYQPVRLISSPTLSQKENFNTRDLLLRGVYTLHLEYIKNMGSASCCSIAIIKDEKLWGLISCHHHTPKNLSVSIRLGLCILGKLIASEVSDHEKESERLMNELIVTLQEEIHNKIKDITDFKTAIESIQHYILKILNAHGMVLFFDDIISSYGDAPGKKDIHDLVSWLSEKNIHKIFATSQLSDHFNSNPSLTSLFPGLLAISLTPGKKYYLLVFKKEIITTIVWAGDPKNIFTKNHSGYSPRTSFKAWEEIIKNKSENWTRQDLLIAKSLETILSLKQLEISLIMRAERDPLTGLYNRSTLLPTCEKQIALSKRNHAQLAIFLIDIDFFKKINDTFSHDAGDTVLIKLSELLLKSIRSYDYAYRYGGEEFLLIIANMTEDYARKKAQEILKNARDMKILYQGKTEIKITLSIGVALFPNNADEPEKLIELADKALYRAKNNGRDQVCFL